ncbi:MAG: hypothetical protein Q8J64_10050 [Thermodesulfovibrionales bacterium]|nr:hypothetical protein [Thermodesulfovibrionales bacterium]
MPESIDDHKKGHDWVEVSRRTHKTLFSELDVLLTAMGKFLNAEDLSASKSNMAVKNFSGELNAARDVILRILGILEAVIPEGRKNAYWFQKYAEARLLSGSKRDSMREETQRQDTPEKSLLLLYDSFIKLKGIVTDLLKNPGITYTGFANIADIIKKNLRENVFFKPFRPGREFDAIENRTISEIVKDIPDKDAKKTISIILLELFKFLRYLGHVDIATPRYAALHSSLLILMLLKHEIEAFREYADGLAAGMKKPQLRDMLQSLSYQFRMETKRVYMQELKDVFEKNAPQELRGKIENSHGILKNLTEQTIIQIAQFWRPDVRGEEIFDSFVTKLEQSLKLRQDIYTFERLISEFQESPPLSTGQARAFASIKSFMAYFESFTFKLLRHDDYEEFSAFFNEMAKVRPEDIAQDEDEATLEKCRHFRIYLETTLRHLQSRSELADRPIDVEKAKAVIRQYTEG